MGMQKAFLSTCLIGFCSSIYAGDTSLLDLIRLNIGQPIRVTESIGKLSVEGKLLEVGGNFFCAELTMPGAGRGVEKRCYPASVIKAIGWRKEQQDPRIIVERL